MNKKRPIPEVVDEKKETHTRGSLLIHSQPPVYASFYSSTTSVMCLL
jgi:hypothetical protein